jgi:hypothetical protein
MGFHAGNISNQSQAKKVHTTHILDRISISIQHQTVKMHTTHSLDGIFMQATSAIKIK